MKQNFILVAILIAFAAPAHADIITDPCDFLEEGDACTMDDGTKGVCSANLICSVPEEDDDGCATSGGSSSFLTVIAGLVLVGVSRFRR
jgi:hypothetical protein